MPILDEIHKYKRWRAEDTLGDEMSLRFLRDAARFYQVHLKADGENTEWVDHKALILPFVKLAEELEL